MAAQDTAYPSQTVISTWMRDYRLSLALLAAGIVMVVAVSAFSIWTNSTGNASATFGAGLAMDLIFTAGGMLILLAGTVAYYHWSGLRELRGRA